MTYEKRLALAKKFNKRIKAGLEVNKVSYEKMILEEELTLEDTQDLIELYDKYEVGNKYSKGDRFHHEGILYRVLQPEAPDTHTAQEDWKPATTPALYIPITPQNVIADWEQRYGGNEYMPGDRVRWEGKIYKCTLMTTYSPVDQPNAWELEP